MRWPTLLLQSPHKLTSQSTSQSIKPMGQIAAALQQLFRKLPDTISGLTPEQWPYPLVPVKRIAAHDAAPIKDSSAPVSAPVQLVPQRSRRQSRRNPIKIAIANIKATYPTGTITFPIRDICLQMDKKRETNHTLEVLQTWYAISGYRLWVENYDCEQTKNAVSKYISNVPPAV